MNPIWILLIWGIISIIAAFFMFLPNADAEIITIQLARTCIESHKNNSTTICPKYEDLMQFDNTVESVSGYFEYNDGYFHRQPTNFKNHCNYYHPTAFPLLLVVDPDDCWNKHKGAKTIVIQAIKPENMIYKLTADSKTSDRINELVKQERELFIDKEELKQEVDSREDTIDNSESKIQRYEDQISDLRADDPPFKKNNLNRQLKWEQQRLTDYKQNLHDSEADLKTTTQDWKNAKAELNGLKGLISSTVINGTLVTGVGRSVDECHDATIGADMELLQDTINYMLRNCEDSTYDSRKIEYTEQTPINILDHKWYQYMKWMREVVERCIVRC